MYQKTIELSDAQTILFARQYGWEEKIQDPEDTEKEIDNPVSAEEIVDKQVEEFINGTIFAIKKQDYEKSKKSEIEALEPNIKVKEAVAPK